MGGKSSVKNVNISDTILCVKPTPVYLKLIEKSALKKRAEIEEFPLFHTREKLKINEARLTIHRWTWV